MARGGKRKGAGRPKGTGKFGEPTKAIRLPISMIDRIMQYIAQKGLILPIYTTQTRPAALSQAEDTQPETLDFIEYLIKKSPSAFFVKMTDDSMTGAGIMPNDILLLERNSEPTHEDIVLAVVDGEFTVKRLVRKPNRIELKPENSKYQPTKINDESELKVWGVVKHAIHQL